MMSTPGDHQHEVARAREQAPVPGLPRRRDDGGLLLRHRPRGQHGPHAERAGRRRDRGRSSRRAPAGGSRRTAGSGGRRLGPARRCRHRDRAVPAPAWPAWQPPRRRRSRQRPPGGGSRRPRTRAPASTPPPRAACSPPASSLAASHRAGSAGRLLGRRVSRLGVRACVARPGGVVAARPAAEAAVRRPRRLSRSAGGCRPLPRAGPAPRRRPRAVAPGRPASAAALPLRGRRLRHRRRRASARPGACAPAGCGTGAGRGFGATLAGARAPAAAPEALPASAAPGAAAGLRLRLHAPRNGLLRPELRGALGRAAGPFAQALHVSRLREVEH